MAPSASPARDDATEDQTPQDTSEKIKDEELQVRRAQEWWADGHGPAAVSKSPILAAIDVGLLAEIISAGGTYHQILTPDRLDGLHRRLGSGTEPALEPLRRALQTRGGSKTQARVVGMLFFREARNLFEQGEGQTAADSASAVGQVAASPVKASSAGGEGGHDAVKGSQEPPLDEAWAPARLFVASAAYPEGAQMAVRAGPSQKSELLMKVPANTQYLATGRIGEFLQIRVKIEGKTINAYVLRSLENTVLLVPAQPAPAPPAPQSADAASAPDLKLDEAWSPPRRYVGSDSYPAGAQMAARAAPGRDAKQIATLPAGTEYTATGRSGDYLQIRLDIEGKSTSAFVPQRLGDLVLLVPAPAEALQQAPAASHSAPAAKAAEAAAVAAQAATVAAAAEFQTSGRVAILEAQVEQQNHVIQALQAEMKQLRTQLGVVSAAFRPLGG